MTVLVRSLLTAGFLVSAATAVAQEAAFDKYKTIVNFAFVKERATIPPQPGVVVIDSRPANGRYDPGHIPGAINISDTFFDKSLDKLPTDKATQLIFYCGGLDCPLSHKSAVKAEALGYGKIAVYAAGFPDWEAKGELVAVSLDFVKGVVAKPEGTVLIDARPEKRFLEGSIPGAINIPDTFFDKHVAKLPADKATPIIFFCGGLQCDLSSKSAVKAKALGYTNVRVFPGGEPAWTAAHGAPAAAAAAQPAKPAAPAGTGLALTPAGDVVVTDAFVALMKENPGAVHVYDVRDAKDFDRGHFPTAKNLPIGKLEAEVDKLPTDKPIVFVCATGARSSEAYDIAKMLRAEIKAHYLDAEVTYNPDGTQVVKGRAKK